MPSVRMRKRTTVVCDVCGSTKEYPPSSLARVKGPKRCSAACRAKGMTGAGNWNWTNGYMDSDGYRRVRVNGVWEYEHRVVMATIIGRPLQAGEVVHHKNEVRNDNRPENLAIVLGNGRHVVQEHREYVAGRRGFQTKRRATGRRTNFWTPRDGTDPEGDTSGEVLPEG